MVFFHFIEDVHGVVGIHLCNKARGIIGVHVFQNITGDFFIQFSQSLGSFVCGEVRQNTELLAQGELFQVFGAVGRVDKIFAVYIAAAECEPCFPGACLIKRKVFFHSRGIAGLRQRISGICLIMGR